MRKKALLAIGAAGIMALGVSAGTFALLSDQANATETLTAGRLSVISWRDQGDSVPGPMFYTTAAEGETTPGGNNGLKPTGPWAPGDSRLRVLMLKNAGTLDAWITGAGASLDSGSMHLADKLRYCISTSPIIPFTPIDYNAQQPMCPATDDVTVDPNVASYLAVGSLGDLINADKNFTDGSNPLKVAMNAGPAPKPFYFYVSLPLDADNSYQSETLKVTFSMNAVQKRNNP
jgi:predicted ribosomally synthesized peptide with SipW-like signal peptide